MIKIKYPIIVEGKYDKIKLSSLVDAVIYTTEGFGIFTDAGKRAFFKKISDSGKIIVLTDSDGAGLVIRNRIKNLIPPERVINLYIPRIHGKEKRKKTASAEGTLGVEGIDGDVILSLLTPYSGELDKKTVTPHVTKADFYVLRLTGGENSLKKREALCGYLGLPPSLNVNGIIEAINEFIPESDYNEALGKIKEL